MRPSLYLAALPVTAPNGLRLSGARKRVRCSRGLGDRHTPQCPERLVKTIEKPIGIKVAEVSQTRESRQD